MTEDQGRPFLLTDEHMAAMGDVTDELDQVIQTLERFTPEYSRAILEGAMEGLERRHPRHPLVVQWGLSKPA